MVTYTCSCSDIIVAAENLHTSNSHPFDSIFLPTMTVFFCLVVTEIFVITEILYTCLPTFLCRVKKPCIVLITVWCFQVTIVDIMYCL